jgi:hypothetical protein
MIAVKAKFDGKQVILPEDFQPPGPGEVIVWFEEDEEAERRDWQRLQEQAMARAWDDEEDSVYDDM